MSITAECNVCGRKYQAPDGLAGKRVRCKQCDNIFTLPETSGNDFMPDLDALANLESSVHGADDTSAGDPAPQDDADEDSASPGALPSARMNVRFSFPMAREVDQWGPLALTILGLLWVLTFGYRAQINSDPGLKHWIAATRVGLALAAFVLIISPLTLAAVRAAGRQLDYRMPLNDRFRAFAAFIPGFALTYIMWLSGDADIGPLIMGALVGLIVAVCGIWLFFRLRPLEIAPTAGYAAGAYLVGIALTAALFLGLNFVAMQLVLALKLADRVPHNMFASSFAWITPEQAAEAAKKPQLATTRSAPSTAAAANTPEADSGLSIGSQVIRVATAAPIPGEIESVVFPLVDAPFLATIRNNKQLEVESWDTKKWTSVGGAKLFPPDDSVKNRFALSPDGDRLAMISRFPKLSAQVWSFKEKQMLPLLYLEDRANSINPEIIGFLTADRLLTRWKSPTGYALEVIDIIKREQVYRLEIPNYEATGNPLVISADGKLAALATKIQNKTTSVFKPTLLFFDLTSGKPLPTTTDITSLDVQWPVTPTGMAFSSDGKKLSILIEQPGNGLLLTYELDPATGRAEKLSEYLFPAGPLPGRDLHQFTGNALAWIPGDAAWLLYGQGLFSVTTGQYISDLAVPGVERYRVTLPDLVQIVGPWPPSARQISTLQLDLAQITTLAKKK